jgi:hypothetical protein
MLSSTYNFGHAVSCIEGIGTDEAVEIHTFLHLCDYAVVSTRLRFRLLCRWWTHIHSLTINTNYLLNQVYSSKCTFKIVPINKAKDFQVMDCNLIHDSERIIIDQRTQIF